KGLPKKGLAISPSGVTSKNRPNEDSQANVLPFGTLRVAHTWREEVPPENGIESSRRCTPLSKIRMLPFPNWVGACWPATVGDPSFQRMLPVLREMRITVDVGR